MLIVTAGGKSRGGASRVVGALALPAWAREMMLLLPFMALLSKGCMSWQLEWGVPQMLWMKGRTQTWRICFRFFCFIPSLNRLIPLWPVVVIFFSALFVPAVVGDPLVLASISFFLAFEYRFLSLVPTGLGDVPGRLVGLLVCGQILWVRLLLLVWWRVLIVPSFVPRSLP